MRFLPFILAAWSGCGSPAHLALAPPETRSIGGVKASSKEIVITEPGKLDSVVGAIVILVGVQTRTKWPTVLGADVDGDDAMSEKLVRVRGLLEKVKNGPAIDGNGNIDRDDLNMLKAYLDKKITLTDKQLKAADLWDDGTNNIDQRDYDRLSEFIDMFDPKNKK